MAAPSIASQRNSSEATSSLQTSGRLNTKRETTPSSSTNDLGHDEDSRRDLHRPAQRTVHLVEQSVARGDGGGLCRESHAGAPAGRPVLGLLHCFLPLPIMSGSGRRRYAPFRAA